MLKKKKKLSDVNFVFFSRKPLALDDCTILIIWSESSSHQHNDIPKLPGGFLWGASVLIPIWAGGAHTCCAPVEWPLTRVGLLLPADRYQTLFDSPCVFIASSLTKEAPSCPLDFFGRAGEDFTQRAPVWGFGQSAHLVTFWSCNWSAFCSVVAQIKGCFSFQESPPRTGFWVPHCTLHNTKVPDLKNKSSGC